MSDKDSLDKIKDFFKSNISINELVEIMDFKPEALFGIDNVSADKLKEANIKKLQDLANLDPENLPEVKDILPPILTKWIKIAKVLEKVVKAQLKS